MNASLIDQARDQGALFNVRSEPLLTESGIAIDNRVAIINESTDSVVGIVSPNYRVVTNHEVLEHLSEAFDESDLDLTGLEVGIRTGYGGARSMIDIKLPAHQVEVRDGDVSQLQITALNSYDGRWKYALKGGAIRMACLNGQIWGNFIASYVEYHNSKLDVEHSARQLVHMAEGFENAAGWWRQLMDRKVDREQVLRCISIFLTGDSKIQDREKFLNRPQVKELQRLYANYSLEMGPTAYALYNMFTDFVTHKKRSEKAGAAMLLNDQERLRGLVNKVKVFEHATA